MPQPFCAIALIIRDASKTILPLLDDLLGNFDEVILVDTGSKDGTRDMICERISQVGEERREVTWDAAYETPEGRIILGSFKWRDDFAAARNFAFGLASAKWVGYVDADDRFDDAWKVDKNLRHIEENNPQCNAVSFVYEYLKDDTYQDVTRFVRWSDGDWTWKDPIHETLECSSGRRIQPFEDIVVRHQKTVDEMMDAYLRNSRIAQACYDSTEDPVQKARMAHHLAQAAKNERNFPLAEDLLRETIKCFGFDGFGAYAHLDLARMAIDAQNWPAALQWAGALRAGRPENAEASRTVALAHAMKGDYPRALYFFEEARSLPEGPMTPLDDVWFTQGLCPAYEALSYVKTGDHSQALVILSTIPPGIVTQERVRGVVGQAQELAMRAEGMARLKAFLDYLIWDTEPLKALRVLQECVPAALETTQEPAISAMYRDLYEKCIHGVLWEEYQERYAAIEPDIYHTDDKHIEEVLAYSRAQSVLNWAKRLSEEGDVYKVLAVGFQDGHIEEAVLKANPRIHLTVCDASPLSNKGLQRLQERYPGRVSAHKIAGGWYDWVPALSEGFDMIVMFEVIEHVPNPSAAVEVFEKSLVPGGRLFMSTPVASRWVEPYLTGPEGPEWYGHLHGFNPKNLSALFDREEWVVDMMEGYDGTYVVDALRLHGRDTKPGHIAILVPGCPEAFDPASLHEGFLGGSEEAVVHLSEALDDEGVKVTVFAPVKERSLGTIRMMNNVMWRPVEEFDQDSDAFTAVLFWRCPQLFERESLRGRKPYQKLLWLHDAYYGAPASAYEGADKVLVLSDAHAACLEREDGWPATESTLFANGIVEEAFPPFEGERDPIVVYASSPDRGLGRLLEMWSPIAERVPGVKLVVTYNWTAFDKGRPDEASVLRAMLEQLREQGHAIEVHYEGLPHADLHDLLRRASVWAYPNTGDVETFCITAVKMQASGVWPVTTNAGALPEVLDENYADLVPEDTIDTDEGRRAFVDMVTERLLDPPSEGVRLDMRDSALERFSWDVTARKLLATVSGW